MYSFYTKDRFSLKLKHYVTKVPDVSKSIKTLIYKLKAIQLQRHEFTGQGVDLIGDPGYLIAEQCRWVSRTLMFTEIEIICWVKYLQRFNLADQKLIEQQAAQCKQKLPDNSKHKQPLDEAQMK